MSIPVSTISPPANTAANAVPNAAAAAPPASIPTAQPASEIDKQDFAAMLRGVSAGPGGQATGAKPHEPSFLEHFASVQTANMKGVLQNSRDMLKQAPNMSLEEMVAFGADFKLNMTIATTQFQVATSVGKSAGKGIDTLMRNQ